MARGEKRRAIQARRPRPRANELLDERAIVVVVNWRCAAFTQLAQVMGKCLREKE